MGETTMRFGNARPRIVSGENNLDAKTTLPLVSLLRRIQRYPDSTRADRSVPSIP